MGQHKLSEAARFFNKLDFVRRLAVVGAAVRNSPAKFTPSGLKPFKNPDRGRYRQRIAEVRR